MNAAADFLQNLIAQKEQELATLRASLELVLRASESPPISTPEPRPSSSLFARFKEAKDRMAPKEEGEYGHVSSMVQSAIEECPPEYVLDNVMRVLHRLAVHNKQAPLDRDLVSQTLSRLARTGKINVKEPGAGRRPAIYTKEVVTS